MPALLVCLPSPHAFLAGFTKSTLALSRVDGQGQKFFWDGHRSKENRLGVGRPHFQKTVYYDHPNQF